MLIHGEQFLAGGCFDMSNLSSFLVVILILGILLITSLAVVAGNNERLLEAKQETSVKAKLAEPMEIMKAANALKALKEAPVQAPMEKVKRQLNSLLNKLPEALQEKTREAMAQQNIQKALEALRKSLMKQKALKEALK